MLNIAKGYTVSVTNISFINGNSSIAGGILNDGGLTLTRVTISNNDGDVAGGVANDTDGTLTMVDSIVNDNTTAGGIINDGTMTLSKVTVRNNLGDQFGGIANDIDGTLVISNSTVDQNSSTGKSLGFAGGLFNFGTGFVDQYQCERQQLHGGRGRHREPWSAAGHQLPDHQQHHANDRRRVRQSQ